MPFYPELESLTFDELVERYRNEPPEVLEEPGWYYSEVALAIRQRGEAGDAYLLASLDNADESRLRSIIFALGHQPTSPLIARKIKRFLSDDRPMILMDVIDALAAYPLSINQADVLRNAQHESPYVRGSVYRFRARTRGRESVSDLVAGLKDGEPIVRSIVIDLLDEMCAVEATSAIERLLADEDHDVREAASFALIHLKECPSP